MRRVLPLLAALVLAAGAAGAVDKWVGVGDSIMTGSTWPCIGNPMDPPICPAVFDCSGGCGYATSGARDLCGVARRLDVWLDGVLGAPDYVKNLGVSGESTSGGVARLPASLDGECGSPGDCIAMILMHGTNDMVGAVSPESAQANLQTMIGQAKARNIDTLLMTIIRKINEPTNSKWSAYRDLIVALAATESVPLVDPYASLCPNASCYNANYWVANSCYSGNPGELDIGHLDPDGYDVMGNLVTAAFPGAVPAMPAPTSPAGDIADTSPDFVWPEVAGVRWYTLEVDAATTTWWEAAANCSGGTCTVNPGVALAKGAHSWRVRARNLRGLGSWSGATAFEIWAVPGTPAPVEPQGTFFDADPMNAPFGWEPYEWSVAADATDYDLVVSDGGGVVFTQSFPSSVCASRCSGSPGHGLAGGDYTFTVQARNPAVSGPLSAAAAFEIVASAPGEPTPTAPTGERFEPLAPLYEWLPASGATEYEIRVKDSGGNVDASAAGLPASPTCPGGRCSYQGGTLPDPDDYTLEVRGSNPLGAGPWSSVVAAFTILECVDPSQQDLHALAPSPVTGPLPAVKHCGPVRAAETAPYVVESGGDLTVHTRDGFAAFSGFTVAGTLSVKSP